MEINLSDIIKNGAEEISFEGGIIVEPIKYMGLEISFKDDVLVKGKVRSGIDGAAMLDAIVSGELCTNCARCLKPVQKPFEAKLSEMLVREDSEQKIDDAIVYEGYTLLLDEIVVDCILTKRRAKLSKLS